MADLCAPGPDPSGETSLPSRLWRDWLIVFVAGLILYVATCAPDVLMSDSGVYQLRIAEFPPTPAKLMKNDLVQVHAVYLAVTKLFALLPVGTVAYRVNLGSAWFGAMALANIFVVARLLTGSRWAAAIGTLSAGLGHTFWAFSVIADCRPLVSACLSMELLALMLFARTSRARWFLLAGLINGVDFSNHLLAALATPVYAILALVWWNRGRLRGVHLLGFIALWFLGASIYLFIVLRELVESGQVAQVLRSATTGSWPAANLRITASLVGKVAGYLALQYPTLMIVLAAVALRVKPLRECDRPIKWTIVSVAVIVFIFAARYPRPDQYKFFMPFYTCVGMLVALGSWALIRRWPWTRWAWLALTVVPVGIYAALPGVARHFHFNPFTREIAYRDPYDFFLRPWQQGDYGVRRFCEEIFAILPKDAMLFADPTPAGALIYVQQVEGKRKDVRIQFIWDDIPMNGLIKAEPPSFAPKWVRPVYTVDTHPRYAPDPFVRDCKFVKEGIIYRVQLPEFMPTKAWK